MEVIQETGSVAMPRSNPMEVGEAVTAICLQRRKGRDEDQTEVLRDFIAAIVRQIARDDKLLALRILNDVSHGWREFGEREGTPL
jgi:hypothetical protein